VRLINSWFESVRDIVPNDVNRMPDHHYHCLQLFEGKDFEISYQTPIGMTTSRLLDNRKRIYKFPSIVL